VLKAVEESGARRVGEPHSSVALMAGRYGGGGWRESSKIFYGWWVVGACFVSMAMAGGIGNLSFPIFLKPLTEEFGWSRAQVSGGISAFMLAIAVTAPLVGRIVGIYGARAVMVPAALVVGLCLMLLACLTSLWQLYALRLGVGVAFTALAHIPVNVTISRWFVRKRGRAMGIAMIGSSVGGLVLTPVVASSVDSLGWRPTLVVLGGVMWVVLAPVLFVFMRNKPADLSLLPDGDTRGAALTGATVMGADEGMSAHEAVRSGCFWALVGVYLLAYTCVFSAMVHQYPYFTDQGFPAGQAALLVSTLLGFAVLSGVTFGWASDRYDVLRLAAVCYAFGATGMAFLLWAGPVMSVAGYIVCFGLLFGGTTPLTALVIGRIFGMKAYGVIYGLYQTVICLSGFIGPISMGYIYDTTGSYRLGFTGVSVGLLCASGLMLLLRSKMSQTAHSVLQTSEPYQ